MPTETFNHFIERTIGPGSWVLARRASPYLRERYAHILTPRRYKALEEQWEREQYGGRLEHMEAAAPKLLEALVALAAVSELSRTGLRSETMRALSDAHAAIAEATK